MGFGASRISARALLSLECGSQGRLVLRLYICGFVMFMGEVHWDNLWICIYVY